MEHTVFRNCYDSMTQRLYTIDSSALPSRCDIMENDLVLLAQIRDGSSLALMTHGSDKTMYLSKA